MAVGLGLAPEGSLQSWGMDAAVGCAQMSWGATCLAPLSARGSSFGGSWVLPAALILHSKNIEK